MGLAALVFAAAIAARRRSAGTPEASLWLRVAAIALLSGSVIGWTIANVPLESLTIGDWMRSLAWAAVALLAPIVAAAATVRGVAIPSFARVLARRAERPRDPLALALGARADRAWWCSACRRRSAWSSTRATAIFRSRRSPARRPRSC